jgi:putative transposase
VLAELMEEEVEEVVGPKGKHNPERTALRHGHETGEVTLGGRRVQVERPRVRCADGSSELALRTYEHFADRDPLSRHVLEQMLAGVSTTASSARASRSGRRWRRSRSRSRVRQSRASSSPRTREHSR